MPNRSTMIFVALIVILCVVLFVRWLFRPKLYNTPPMLPGGLPFIGHAHKFIGDAKYTEKFLTKIFEYSLEKGGVIQMRMGPHPIYVLTDVEDSLTVANTCLDKPYVYDFAKEMYGIGLIIVNGPTWKKQRKLLTPCFNQQLLDTFLVVFNEQSRYLVSQFSTKVGKVPFSPRRDLIQLALRTVSRTSLVLQPEDQNIRDSEYAQGVEDIFEVYQKRSVKVWLHLSFLFNLSSLKKQHDKIKKKMNNIMNPIIKKRKLELKYTSMQADISPAKFKPLLDQLLNLADTEGGMTDKDIREQLDTFVTASFDTVSMAFEYCLLMIGTHNHVQERIYKELQEVFGGEDRDVDKYDLAKLVYVEAVLREVLRLHPPVTFVGRKIDQDVKLKNYTLPAGGTCILGLYGINRHSVWGADANEFKPERWLNPETIPADPTAFSSFSIGKRNCIGIKYSFMLLKTALALVLQRFHVTSDISDLELEWKVSSKPVSGNLITLSLRNEIKTQKDNLWFLEGQKTNC